jgi:hypothetical protein
MTEIDYFAAGRELARRSRAEQGLPPKVTDPAILKLVAALLCPIGDDGRGVLPVPEDPPTP